MIRPPSFGSAPGQYEPTFFNGILRDIRAFIDRMNAPYPHNASTLNISRDTLPTDADAATLRDGDVFRDSTASNVLKSWPAAIGGGGAASWTEVEIDFGSTPVYDATFTITDAAITSSTVKMALVPCGKAATGRTADDWQWDGGTVVANPGTGSARCYATFTPGPIVGRRKLQYQIG